MKVTSQHCSKGLKVTSRDWSLSVLPAWSFLNVAAPLHKELIEQTTKQIFGKMLREACRHTLGRPADTDSNCVKRPGPCALSSHCKR